MRLPATGVLVELRFRPGRLVAAQPAPAPEETVDAGKEDREVERLGQVVVGARLEPVQHVVGARARGEQHDRHELPRRAEPPDHLEPVETGQHDVEEDDVEAAGVGVGADETLEGDRAVLLDLGRVPFRFEIQLEARGEMLLVLDDENAAHEEALSGSSSVKVLPRSAPRLSA